MPDQKYQRDTQRFDFLGIDLNRPVDSVKPARLPFAQNVRSFLAGRLECRDGITEIGQVVAGQNPVHSVRRLNDAANNTWTRVIGTGTHLAVGQTSFTDTDSGYSGNPLTLVPWKPVQSPTSFMYVADSQRMSKVSSSGALHPIGLPAPANHPDVALTSPPQYKDIDTFNATTGWAATSTASGINLLSRTPGGASGSTTTISQILYDTGTTGWASVQLASMSGVTRGAKLTFQGESAYVQDVFAGTTAVTATTIAQIIYDSGTSGPCSIQLAASLTQIEVQSLLNDSTVGERIRVVAKVANPNGTFSIRATTVGTFSAGDNIQVLPSFRVYLTLNHTTSETVSNDAVFFQVANGQGYIQKTLAIDLSQIAANVPTQQADYMSIGVICDRPDLLTEMKVQMDVDATTNNFTGNYYWRAIRPNDLTPAVANLQSLITTRQQIIQKNIIDAPQNLGSVQNVQEAQKIVSGQFVDPSIAANLPSIFQEVNSLNQAISQQLAPGVSQWVEVRFPISDLQRVGTDQSRSLQNVAKVQILVTVTGTVNIGLDSWWIGGGYGPDDNDATAIPYYYRYRARVFATGVPSSWSPATRLSQDAYRQSITVSMPQYTPPTNLATTDIVLDVFRYGGQLTDWYYVGTTPNSATPSFADIYPDLTVGGNPVQAYTDFQPWPIIGLPVSGTTGTVSGTSVLDSGANFNLSWAPGTRILINNQPYTIYRVVTTSYLELVESAGSQVTVVWQIYEPTILAQPLPVLWQWNDTFFACGDKTNPGRLYYSNPDTETTDPTNYLDVTSPSEPLMNGLQYNVRSYLFSSEGFIQILPTGNPDEPYITERIPNGKGLFSQWAMNTAPAPAIFFLSRDGINMTTGGSPIPLTDADLYELFPNEGNPGVTVNGIPSPSVALANAAELRLTYYDEYLYFDYIGQDGNYYTLLLNFDLGAAQRGEAPGGWMWDVYNPQVIFRYGEEGASVHNILIGAVDSNLYEYGGLSDNGQAIVMGFTTPSRDQGEPRTQKLYGDILLDCNTAGLDAVCTPYFDSNLFSIAPTTINTTVRQQAVVPLIGYWQTALNISLFIKVSVSSVFRPFFYIWEPRWTMESAPISAFSWAISPTTFGMEGFKHFGICKVTHVSNSDIFLDMKVDGVPQPTITIENSGGVYEETIFRVPVMKGKLFQLQLSSAAEFRLDTRDSFFEVKDWGQDSEYQKLRIFSDYALVEG